VARNARSVNGQDRRHHLCHIGKSLKGLLGLKIRTVKAAESGKKTFCFSIRAPAKPPIVHQGLNGQERVEGGQIMCKKKMGGKKKGNHLVGRLDPTDRKKEKGQRCQFS